MWKQKKRAKFQVFFSWAQSISNLELKNTFFSVLHPIPLFSFSSLSLGIVFIRGESVAVLPVYVDIEDGGKEYIICLSQPRFATGLNS